MRSRFQPLAPDDWVPTMRACANNVGPTHGLLNVLVGTYLAGISAPELPRQRLRLPEITARDADRAELPDTRHRAQVSPCLNACPNDDEPRRVLPRQKIGRQCRARGGAGRGDGLAVHQREGAAVPRVEDDDDGLVRRPVGVPREERNELRRESAR